MENKEKENLTNQQKKERAPALFKSESKNQSAENFGLVLTKADLALAKAPTKKGKRNKKKKTKKPAIDRAASLFFTLGIIAFTLAFFTDYVGYCCGNLLYVSNFCDYPHVFNNIVADSGDFMPIL